MHRRNSLPSRPAAPCSAVADAPTDRTCHRHALAGSTYGQVDQLIGRTHRHRELSQTVPPRADDQHWRRKSCQLGLEREVTEISLPCTETAHFFGGASLPRRSSGGSATHLPAAGVAARAVTEHDRQGPHHVSETRVRAAGISQPGFRWTRLLSKQSDRRDVPKGSNLGCGPTL
jgi:hypothetical protein